MTVNGIHKQNDDIVAPKGMQWEDTMRDKFTYMGAPYLAPIIVKGQGSHLWDSNGKKYLDFTSGQLCSILGQCHPEITKVIAEQNTQLCHALTFLPTSVSIRLADRLTSLLPPELCRCQFLSTGSESVEAALRLARAATGKLDIVALNTAYHGMSGGANSATYAFGRRAPITSGSFVLPTPVARTSPFRRSDGSHDWEAELDYAWKLIDSQSTGSLAALLLEPITGAGGIIALPKGYMTRCKEECAKRDMLLIVDEAVTGMGRTGDLFAFQSEKGFVPDILCLSKSLGGGMPLAATICTDRVNSMATKGSYVYYTSHQNDPIPCAVGARICEIVSDQAFLDEVKRKGQLLQDGLKSLMNRLDCIGEVRGRGLMIGIEIVKSRETMEADVDLGGKISEACLELGLSCNVARLAHLGAVFRIIPPLTITDEEIQEGVKMFGEAVAQALQA